MIHTKTNLASLNMFKKQIIRYRMEMQGCGLMKADCSHRKQVVSVFTMK